ncbi:MAG: hypothetical protein VKL39_04510 [Leptolyngbyaceae bacterium]|nr:hypothetical protein [Leptolyngbyaceae bacterium]
MNTLVHQSDLSTDLLRLGQVLQSFLSDLPIGVQCATREGRLIVLGQHPEYAGLNPAYILKILERKIQSFQLDFTQQVRVYLRVAGETQPYAHRWFMIQPPPPPPPIFFKDPTFSVESEDEPWLLDDDELDVLVHQLTAMQPLDNQFVAIAPDSKTTKRTLSESQNPSVSTTGIGLHPISLRPKAKATVTSIAGQVTPSSSEIISAESISCEKSENSLSPYSHSDGEIVNREWVDGELVLSLDDASDDSESPDDASRTFALPDLSKLTRFYRQTEEDESTGGRSLQLQARDQIRLLSRTVLTQLNTRNTAILSPQRFKELNGKTLATTGLAVLGLAGTAYALTRPCVIGECAALTKADDLSDASSILIQNAESWPEIEMARDKLIQAIELLDPVPIWSGHSEEAAQHIAAYEQQLINIEALLDIEALARTAIKAERAHATASITDLQNIHGLWQQAITKLEAEPATSAFYPMALQELVTYRAHAAQLTDRIEHEQHALQTLDNAKQAAELAHARQRVARSLEHWQLARVTWLVALERLETVPEGTVAGQEAHQLMASYQDALDQVNQRVHREQAAVRILEQAEERAQVAQAAEQRFDWQQAVQDWDQAIAFAQRVDHQTNYQLQAEELLQSYTTSLDEAQEKLNLSEEIETELEKTCIGELRICNFLSVGATISVQLDEDYVEAINAARDSGNARLQAVVTDHQVILRQALEQIARDYQLSVEVYDAENRLLERHGRQHADG